jgi:hypothetical protein
LVSCPCRSAEDALNLDRQTKRLGERALVQADAWEASTAAPAPPAAGHASTRTTQLYDRRSDKATLADVERIRLE